MSTWAALSKISSSGLFDRVLEPGYNYTTLKRRKDEPCRHRTLQRGSRPARSAELLPSIGEQAAEYMTWGSSIGGPTPDKPIDRMKGRGTDFFYQARDRQTKERLALDVAERSESTWLGERTIGLYAINPMTRRSNGRDRRRLRRCRPRSRDPQNGAARTGWGSRHRGECRRGAPVDSLRRAAAGEALPIHIQNLALRPACSDQRSIPSRWTAPSLPRQDELGRGVRRTRPSLLSAFIEPTRTGIGPRMPQAVSWNSSSNLRMR